MKPVSLLLLSSLIVLSACQPPVAQTAQVPSGPDPQVIALKQKLTEAENKIADLDARLAKLDQDLKDGLPKIGTELVDHRDHLSALESALVEAGTIQMRPIGNGKSLAVRKPGMFH